MLQTKSDNFEENTTVIHILEKSVCMPQTTQSNDKIFTFHLFCLSHITKKTRVLPPGLPLSVQVIYTLYNIHTQGQATVCTFQ